MIANARVWNAVVFPSVMKCVPNATRPLAAVALALVKDRTFATIVNLIQVKSLDPNHHIVENVLVTIDGRSPTELMAGRYPYCGSAKNTPTEIVDKLNNEINAALTDPKVKSRLSDWGASALPGSPADFGKLITEETEKWGKVVKFAGIKAE
jgi:hypothetical protein